MTGRFTHIPHRHTRPPLFASSFNPVGTVWACDCGKRYTLVAYEGRKAWDSDIPPVPMTELDKALAFIRHRANVERATLGLPLLTVKT